MRIDRLSVKNWRNFKSAEISMGSRLFIVGPNASGKSNLLDALRFLRDVAKTGGGLQQAIQDRGGLRGVRCLTARNFNHGWVGLEITLKTDDNIEWTYKLHFTGKQGGKHRPEITKEVVTKNTEEIINRPDSNDKKDPELLTQTALEQVSSNQNFRSIASFLHEISYMHLVPQIIRHYELGQENIKDSFGSGFLVDIAQTNKRTRNSRLNKINEALRCAIPQIRNLSFSRDEAGMPHLQASYDHWRPDPALQDERDFSDGTLRLIGLLWVLHEGTSSNRVVLLEEPELSLHAAIVRQLPTILYRMTRDRGQVILSTHSGEMLMDPGLGVNEVVILKPEDEGTTVTSVADLPDIDKLLTADLNLNEILEPKTRPSEVNRLSRSFQ